MASGFSHVKLTNGMRFYVSKRITPPKIKSWNLKIILLKRFPSSFHPPSWHLGSKPFIFQGVEGCFWKKKTADFFLGGESQKVWQFHHVAAYLKAEKNVGWSHVFTPQVEHGTYKWWFQKGINYSRVQCFNLMVQMVVLGPGGLDSY